MSEFTNEHHEILFALLILKANHISYDDICTPGISDEFYIQTVSIVYSNVFRDRAICEEPWEFEVVDRDYCDVPNEYRTKLILKHDTQLGPLVYKGDKIHIERILVKK
jgi:hypothetical protein